MTLGGSLSSGLSGRSDCDVEGVFWASIAMRDWGWAGLAVADGTDSQLWSLDSELMESSIRLGSVAILLSSITGKTDS